MLIKANMWDDRTVEMHLVATVVLRIWFIHMNRIWIQDDQTLLDDLINLGNFLTVLCFWTIHRLWDHVRRTFHPGHKCHSPHYRGPCLPIRPYLGENGVKLSHPSIPPFLPHRNCSAITPKFAQLWPLSFTVMLIAFMSCLKFHDVFKFQKECLWFTGTWP